MELVPHERSLVERMEGRPFVMLGVNCDPLRKSLKTAIEKNRMTWRSFWDGYDGAICKQLNISSFPTVYVLDHNGVIHSKMAIGTHLDKLVDELVRKAELELAGR